MTGFALTDEALRAQVLGGGYKRAEGDKSPAADRSHSIAPPTLEICPADPDGTMVRNLKSGSAPLALTPEVLRSTVDEWRGIVADIRAKQQQVQQRQQVHKQQQQQHQQEDNKQGSPTLDFTPDPVSPSQAIDRGGSSAPSSPTSAAARAAAGRAAQVLTTPESRAADALAAMAQRRRMELHRVPVTDAMVIDDDALAPKGFTAAFEGAGDAPQGGRGGCSGLLSFFATSFYLFFFFFSSMTRM
jgi:hypothetical protein